MTSIQLSIASIFLISAFICLLATAKTVDIPNKGIRQSIQALLLTSSGWAMTQFVQLLVLSEPLAEAIQIFGLIFGISTVPAWLFFVSTFTGRNFHQSNKFQIGVLFAIITILSIKTTNPIHQLYFTVETVSVPFNSTQFDYGIFHHIITILSYSVIFYGFWLLYVDVERLPITKKKLLFVTGFLIIPAVASIISTFNLVPLLGSLSYDPVGVSLFSLVILFFTDSSVTQFQALKHQTFFNEIDNPVLIIDKESRNLIDFNATAGNEPFALTQDNLGTPVTSIFNQLSLQTDVVTVGSNTYSVLVTTYPSELVSENYALIFKDITQVENQREQLEIKQAHFENMVEGLSHELRNGLQIIQGYSNMESVDDDQVEIISDTADRLDRVSDDLTALAKVGQSNGSEGQIEFQTMMKKVEQDSKLVQGLTITYSGQGTLCLEERLFRLLLEKVCVFSEKTDSTTVDLTLHEDELIISTDGDAMDSSDPYGIFEYGKAIPSAELGSILPVVKSIADSHSWDLKIIESQTGFSFKLIGVTTHNIDINQDLDEMNDSKANTEE